jgi:subtilisin family serine protease
MPHRRCPRSTWLLLLAALLACSAPAHPIGALTVPPSSAPAQAILAGNQLAAGFGMPGSAPLAVMIELWDAPALVAWEAERRARSAAGQAARARGRAIESVQRSLLPHIAAAGGRVVYRLQRTLNGIAAHIPADRIAELRRRPEVKSIRPIIPKSVDNATGAALIGAPQLWSAGVGVRGEGITIGIIDTGVDYLHTTFGGSGRATDYQRNNTTAITDEVGFPSAKVVGGYDFAGDAYDASTLATFFPNPDPDPMDCAGHGTHVAGTAGGYGVNADGTTFAGPWNATSVPTATMRIGPGVAPRAQLYALRIFGCVGTTILVAQALEWATDPNGDFEFGDHLDVANLSLGAPFGGQELDPDVDAANNAALAGTIVVISAGNSGDTFFNVGEPSTADWAISVASSLDSTAITGAMRVSAPAAVAGLYAANEAAFGPNLATSGALTGTLRYPGGGQGKGCATFSAANAALLRGRIALVDRGTCSFKTKVRNAQAAGAIGALVANNVATYPAAMPNDPSITTPITIPAMFTTQAAGDALKAHLNDPGGVIVTLTAAYRNARKNVDLGMVDLLSTFSSRGPRRGDGALKPDVTAPGDTIFSAASGTGNRGVSFNGTSMAAPHVAGAMALLRQIHPDWSVEELKALLMNTTGVRARSAGQTGAIFSPSRQGAGRVVLPAAAQAGAVAYNADAPGQVSVSFGMPQVVGAATLVRNVRVVNKRGVAATYDIGVTQVITASGVTIGVFPSQLTLSPYGSATFAVQATIDAAQLDRTLDPATAGTQDGAARQFLNEHSGYLTLSGPDTLSLPFYLAPRPAAAMRAAGALSFPLGQNNATLALRGTGVATPAYRSRVWAFELQEHNIDDAFTTGPQNAGDIKYIGIASDLPTAGALTDNTMIYFGISTFAPWSSANPQDTGFLIYIDTDADGEADFTVINSNLAQARGGSDASDAFVAAVVDLDNGRVVATHPINALAAASGGAPYRATALVLPVAAGDLGLKSGRSRFSYLMFAFQRENFGPSDGSRVHSFDPAAPALSLGGPPLLDDRNGVSAQLRINRGSWLRDQAEGLLLLHELNAAPAQAEEVVVAVEMYRTLLPVVGR